MKLPPLIFVIQLHLTLSLSLLQTTPPPLPILPIPTTRQLAFHHSELAIFLHFGTNTYTDTEWGSGHADPSLFNPTLLDARQWAHTASSTGFSRLVLTAKHHDGFCLWPTAFTNYSVRSSPWRSGNGDVVADLAAAVREKGLQLGVYLSPWDRHEECYGKTREYNEYYLAQMTELLSRYGEIKEVFLDGAKGEGEKDMEYFFDIWFDMIHQLQPKAIIFTDAGPDIRYVGDENGVAGSTCWSPFNRSAVTIGGTDYEYLNTGDPWGQDWVPAECDVSIRPGWFWHASETPKSPLTLLDIYYKSVGRNCPLLLNVPPNSSGLISEEDIRVLQEFSKLRSSIFSTNLAKCAIATASSTRGGIISDFGASCVLEDGIYTYWAPAEDRADWILYLTFKERVAFNVLQIQEPIQLGQRIISFHVDILNDNSEWHKITNGTTVGYKRLLLFPKVESQHLRLVIEQSRADPLISFLGVHMDPYSAATSVLRTPNEPVSLGAKFIRKFKEVFLNSNSLREKFLGFLF